MKTLALLLLTLPGAASAAPRALPPLVGPAASDALRAVVAKAKAWTSVFARVDRWGDSWDIREGRLNLSLRGSKFGSGYSFSGWSGRDSVYFTASGDARWGWSFWGSDLNLNLRPSGASYYYLSGTVAGRPVNLTLSRFGDGFSVWGQAGVSLNCFKSGSGWALQGSLDEEPGAARLVGALGAAIAVISGQ